MHFLIDFCSLLARFSTPTCLPKSTKIHQKSIQKSINFLMLFEIGFLGDFGRFWDPKWSQVGTKIGPKIDLNFGRPILQKTL